MKFAYEDLSDGQFEKNVESGWGRLQAARKRLRERGHAAARGQTRIRSSASEEGVTKCRQRVDISGSGRTTAAFELHSVGDKLSPVEIGRKISRELIKYEA